MGVFHLVLCVGLNASLNALRAVPPSQRAFDSVVAALERPSACAVIDPCAAASAGGAAPAGQLLWRNSSALAIAEPSGGGARRNLFNTEFARVPEGIVLEACSPDIPRLRDGVLQCAPSTLVSVTGACPRAYEYSPLRPADCAAAVEYDATTERDCSLGAANNCSVPHAAVAGSAQLLKWSFAPGFGCFAPADRRPGERLSRVDAPNRLDACPVIANADPVVAANATACDFQCHPGYDKAADGRSCVWRCSGATQDACDAGARATLVCPNPDAPHGHSYLCEPCPRRPGSQPGAWSPATPAQCTYDTCSAGTASADGAACVPCPKHTFSAANATACAPCEVTDTYASWSAGGAAACAPCLTGSAPAGAACPDGFFIGTDYGDVRDHYTTHGALDKLDVQAACERGYACLPCPPGSFGAPGSGACAECAVGSFQANFAATACVPCDDTQTTAFAGASSASECVCIEGFTQ